MRRMVPIIIAAMLCLGEMVPGPGGAALAQRLPASASAAPAATPPARMPPAQTSPAAPDPAPTTLAQPARPAATPAAPPGLAPPADRLAIMRARGLLRVCHWPEYFAITWRNPRSGELEGLDIDMARALALRLQLRLELVETSFAGFQDLLEQGVCDIAMMGVAVTPERARRLAFSKPYLSSPIYAVTTTTSPRIRTWADLDRPGMALAVAAGTFMEGVMRQSLRQAALVVLRPPQSREQELLAGRVDAFMSDYPYTRQVLALYDWARVIEPPDRFGESLYAYAVALGETAWLAEVNAFLAAVKADGQLAAAAARHGLTAILLR